MKLSYIIPVYKVEKYLNQCIDSILAQTMDDYEIILVDDGSPDNCPKICDEYKEKYPDKFVVIHKKNEGLACARNSGLNIAKGEYVFFFDSDDFLDNDSVSKIYEKAKRYNADIVHLPYYSYDEDTKQKSKIDTAFEPEKIYNHSDMETMINYHMNENILIYVWRNLYRTSFLKTNNIWSDPKLRTMQDTPMNMEAFLKSKIFVATDIPILCYRNRPGSIQRTRFIPDREDYYIYQWRLKIQKYKENCTQTPVFFSAIAERNIKVFLPAMLYNYYSNKTDDRYRRLKKIGNSDMMRQSFKDYDINKFKSKSLDWWMIFCIKHKLYPLAHFICIKIH